MAKKEIISYVAEREREREREQHSQFSHSSTGEKVAPKILSYFQPFHILGDKHVLRGSYSHILNNLD